MGCCGAKQAPANNTKSIAPAVVSSPNLKKYFEKLLAHALAEEKAQEAQKEKVTAELKELTGKCFEVHDANKDGILDKAEGAAFLANYMHEWVEFMVNWEKSTGRDEASQAKVKKVLADYNSDKDAINKAAFKVLCGGKDKLKKAQVVEALTPGTDANDALDKALTPKGSETGL